MALTRRRAHIPIRTPQLAALTNMMVTMCASSSRGQRLGELFQVAVAAVTILPLPQEAALVSFWSVEAIRFSS